MHYEELDDITRQYMLKEFEIELNSELAYVSKALSEIGKGQFPDLMKEAIMKGDENTLYNSIAIEKYWEPTEIYNTKTGPKERKRNIEQSATRLATSEFSTFYVKGLAKKLLDEGEVYCEIYRGAQAKWEPGECAEHEGQTIELQTIYNNHRKKYWPEPGDKGLFAIPFGPGCHHLIRRYSTHN